MAYVIEKRRQRKEKQYGKLKKKSIFQLRSLIACHIFHSFLYFFFAFCIRFNLQFTHFIYDYYFMIKNSKLTLIESCYSNIPPPPVFSTVCNASSSSSASHIQMPYNQTAYCSNQHHLVPSKAVGCNSICSSSIQNAVCSSNCASNATNFNHSYANHPSIPHSKSLEHYHEPNKVLENHHGSRHSFDQPYHTNYDCIDGRNERHTNGYYSRNGGIYHQSNCNHQTAEGLYNVSGNRYPLPAQLSHADHHYAQIVNFDRSDNFLPATASCCHQSPHYECLNNFSSRN